MGFFSDLLQTVGTVGATLLGGPVAGAAVGTLLGGGEETLAVGKVGGAVLTPTQLTAVGGTAQQIIAATGGKAAITGGLRKITIVQTVNSAGQVVKQKTHKGGVAVFQADVTAANRVARQVRRLEKRMPRKIVKQSEAARLKDEVTNAALRHARDVSSHHLLPPPRC